MKLKSRIKFYVVGLGLGLIASAIIFQGRGWSWLPGNRVLNALKNAKIHVTHRALCEMECESISAGNIYTAFKDGSINFSESKTKGDVKHYRLTHEKLDFVVKFNPKDSTAIINHLDETKCSCNLGDTSEIELFYQPETMILEELSRLKLKETADFSCQLNCYGLKDYLDLFKLGRIDFSLSMPERKNPVYVIFVELRSEQLVFLIEKGMSRTRMLNVRRKSELIPKKNPQEFMDQLLTTTDGCDCKLKNQ